MLGRGMSFVLYVVVLAVSISSVMMGLDWLSSPPPPVPKSAQVARAPAKPVATKANAAAKVAKTKPAATNAAATKTTEAKTAEPKTAESKTAEAKATGPKATEPNTTTTAATKTAESKTAAPKPVVATTGEASPANAGAAQPPATANGQAASTSDTLSIIANETNGGTDAQAKAGPLCDVPACAAHYRSFNATDCTYQPYDGPRRLCTVGNPPKQADAAPAGVQTSDASPPSASSSCNVQACAAAYRSFDPATCTYQPYDGPRRLCTK